MRVTKGWFCALLICVLVGCTVPAQIVREGSKPTKPEWMTRLPQDQAFLYFIGISTGAESLETGENAAIKDALGKIAGFLGTTIEAQFEIRSTEVEQQIKEQLRAKTGAQVTKASVADSYYEKMTRIDERFRLEKFDVYILIRFPKEETEKELKRRETEMAEKVKGAYALYQKGKAHEAASEYGMARRLYREALHALVQVETVIPLGEPEVKNSSELLALLRHREKEATRNLRKVYVWIREKNLDQINRDSVLANHVMATLAQEGFSVLHRLSPDVVAADSSFDGALAGERRILQRLNSRDIRLLVIGEARTTYSSFTMENYFYYAQGSLRVLNTITGETVVTIPINSRGNHRERIHAGLNALEEAGKAVGKLLVKELMAKEGE